MKKNICLSCIFFLVCNAFCNAQSLYDFENQEYFFCAYYDDLRSPPFKFSFYNGIFNLDLPELNDEKIANEKPIKGKIQEPYKIKLENGFVYILIKEKKFLVLYKEALICVLIDCQNNDAFFGLNKNSKYVSVGEGIRPFVGITGQWSSSRQVSSFLTETIRGKRIEYDGSKEKYYYELTKPWVEGVDGYGIREWIEVEPFGNTRKIVFFNGYIDPNRPDLFYSNSRIKEIVVTTKQGEQTFQIHDTPNPQILALPNIVDHKIRITITDVYKGNRFSDTCLAGIYFLRIRGQ